MSFGDGATAATSDAIDVNVVAQRPSAFQSRIKRAFDLLAAALILFFIAPLLVIIALSIWGDSQGPIFFIQRRTGHNGKTIKVFKFRTMTVLDDGDVIRHASRDDVRVTAVGRFLRSSSLDELPQLLNVVRGDMSLVGPRPHALAHDQYYGALVGGYIERFRVRPGITGLAQISGFRGEIKSLDQMVSRVDLDNQYIEDWSFSKDVHILAKTVLVIFPQKDVY